MAERNNFFEENAMPSIALMTIHAEFPWFRQIPGGGDCIGTWRFTLNTIAEDCALVVVYDEPLAAFDCPLPIERRVLITSEPPGMRSYNTGYANQFGILLGPIEIPRFTGIIKKMQPAIGWFYGVGFRGNKIVTNLDYNALFALPPPPKREAVSIVVSKKAMLPMHRARLTFVEEAQRILGDRVEVFGRGFREIADKAEAIDPFAYHIVLENNDIPHFWTEKLADSLLGWALPIYSGCANLDVYFPEGSFIPLDIRNPRAAALRLKAILDDAPYTKSLPALTLARKRLLEDHNLFFLLTNYAQELQTSANEGTKAGTMQSIKPNAVFAPQLVRLWGRFRKGWKRMRQVMGSNKHPKP